MMAGKQQVIAASLRTKLEGMMTRVMPEALKAERHRMIAEPGSAKH